MLVLESDTLVTIAASAVFSILSALATWWLTRRHYKRRLPHKLTPEDIELARVRHNTIIAFLGDYGALMALIMVGGVLLALVVVSLLLYNLFGPTN